MGLFSGKKGLVFGVANKNSIAWGITQALHDEGADLGISYAGEVLTRRVEPLAESIGCDFVQMADVTNPQEMTRLFEAAADRFGQLDFLVHCIAFAHRDDISGRFVDTSRDGFLTAMEISCYSLITLTNHARPLMAPGSSVLTLSYYGSEKVVPNYNVMGVAKAALEATVRYLAWDLGPEGIRVNAISAGPIKTLAAAGIAGFRKSLHLADQVAPLGNVTQDDVGDAARYLLSDLSKRVTGETLHVDGGYNIMGAYLPDD
ncbi:MAG: enoyl-ACP reductase [Anaerolineales bacterium]|nr:enoyl-ACP reductase [Anaerolineales bacterium]MCB9172267.1 enoyl-ACP reductase [Ardenticatenales bacterium]